MDPAFDPLQIAIDGPAGSGKSTVAARLAHELGMVHVDTGAMYRALTLVARREGIGVDDAAALSRRLLEIEMEFVEGRIHLDGEDVSEAIRSNGVTSQVSQVSAHEQVRRAMVVRQRRMCRAARQGAVIEGRDIGSVVLPLSRCKIYLDAAVEERARRRLLQQGEPVDADRLERMREEIARRDRLDTEREHSPLVIAPDAHVIDSTALTLDEVVQRCVEHARAAVPAPVSHKEIHAWRFTMRSYQAAVWLLRLVFFRPFGMRVYGLANQAADRNFLFACNHISHFDPPVAGSVFRRELYFLAKAELFGGFFGRLIRHFRAIPIRRGRWDEQAMGAAVEALRSGASLMFFPEGTRKPAGRPGPAKRGLGILWEESGVPMIPVYVRGTDRLRRCLLRRERLEVWVGPPLRLHALEVLQKTMTAQQIHRRIGDLWLACIEELAERSEQEGGERG